MFALPDPPELVPEPASDEDKDRVLREHLQLAHDAAETARNTIAQIIEEFRFPLAASTRVGDPDEG